MRPPQIRFRHRDGSISIVKLTKKAQTRLVGNSVPPNVAAAIIRASLIEPRSVGRVA